VKAKPAISSNRNEGLHDFQRKPQTMEPTLARRKISYTKIACLRLCLFLLRNRKVPQYLRVLLIANSEPYTRICTIEPLLASSNGWRDLRLRAEVKGHQTRQRRRRGFRQPAGWIWIPGLKDYMGWAAHLRYCCSPEYFVLPRTRSLHRTRRCCYR
jgi:hypothetical protein